MINSCESQNEKFRLQELDSFKLIDLKDVEEFDIITSMAAIICDVKITLISLITVDKQLILSNVGTDLKEINREISFCNQVIKNPSAPLIIEDIKQYAEFKHNPFLTINPNIVFYAGFPLVTENGSCLGALSVIDDKPNNLNPTKIKKLQKLADLCIKLFNYRKKNIQRDFLMLEIDKKNGLLEETQGVNNLGIWELDIESGRIIWSDIVYKIHEVPKNFDINLSNGIAFYHPNYINKIQTALDRCIHQFESFNLECILITAKKNQKWVRATGRRVGDRLIGSFQDITELKNNELKFKAIFNSTFTFIGFLDTNGVLLEANDTAVNMAGITHQDVIGRYFWDCYWWQISEDTKQNLKVNFQKALSGQTIEYEVEVWVANRTPVTILFTLKPIFDENGQVVFVIPEGRSIQDIINANRRLKSVLEGANVATWEWNVQTGATVFNERWAEIVGYTLDELAPVSIDTWMQLTHPVDLEESGKKLNDCFEKKVDYYEFEARMKHKNGHWVWVYDEGKVVEWTKEGKPLMMYGTHQDITDRKQYEFDLKISEEAFRGNFENAGIGMALVGIDGDWLKVNPELCKILGYSEQELLKLTFQDITHPEDLTLDLTLLDELVRGTRDHYQMEKRYFHKEGHLIYSILAVSMVRDSEDNILYFISQIIDISKRKKQEFELSYQQNLLSAFYELSPIGIALTDYETGNFLDGNEKLIAPTGYYKKEFLLLKNVDITPKEYASLDARANQQLKKKGAYDLYEKELLRKNGTRYPVALQGVVVNDINGGKLVWSIIRDISTEKEAERKLKEALSNFQAVLDASKQVSIIATDTNGNITLFNSGAQKLLGYTAKEMEGKQTPVIIHLEEEIHKESRSLALKYNNEISGFETFVYEAKIGKPTTKEWTYKHKNGDLLPVLLSVNTITVDEEIVGYLGIATDISMLKKVNEIQSLLQITEEQNDRLKNFAEIVSHNLRSHSGGISGLIDFLEMDIPDLITSEPFNLLKTGANNLQQTVDDLTNIVKVSLTQQSFKKVNIFQVVEKNKNSLSLQILQSEIEILNQVNEKFEINCVPAYMDSIVLNFMTNAIKYKSQKRNSFLKIKFKEETNHYLMVFEDNGLGIDLDKFGDKVFGLYKTFHNHQDSRGVGLFITKNQIESMGGKLTVESEVDMGTTFTIKFKKYNAL